MRKTASIIAFVLALVVCIGSVPMPDMQTYCYVEEETAAEYAESFIDEQIAVGIADNWNDSTQIAETVYTYDTDGYINGYIFNLETNGEESGYIVLDALDYNLMNVTAFGLENKYHLTDEELFPELENRAIVNNGLLDYCYKKNNKYYDAESGTELTATKTELKEVRAESIAITNELKAEAEVKRAEAAAKANSGISTYSYNPGGNIPDDYVAEVNLHNLESFRPWEMDDFSSLGVNDHCSLTVIMNMMKYWVDCGGLTKSDLFLCDCNFNQYNELATFVSIAETIGFSYNPNTDTAKVPSVKTTFDKFRNYLSKNYKKSIKGDDYLTSHWIDWAWFKTQFTNGNAVYVCMKKNSDNVYTVNASHAVLAVGAYAAPGNNYLRIADGWSNNTKHFILYTYERYDSAWYYRWA